MNTCPCGNSATYEECCGAFHKGIALPSTAEALMRSRYCAYVKGELEYLVQTVLPERRSPDDRKAAKQWSEGTDWLGLEILKARGGQGDQEGLVEFIARYRQGETDHSHHEVSRFKRRGERWFFSDGKVTPNIPAGVTVSRNAPCPCGSGKKYKKCCAD